MIKSKEKASYLVGFIALVLIMIALGGVTRLTRSGLSIVEWRPVVGSIPPITQEQWQLEFEKYQKTPEFNLVNSHFTLQEYKKIFLWEYLHRLLGRIIFLFVLIPGIYLYRKKKLEGAIVVQLAALVALQGLVGWLMVKSGLNVMPRVSPYMLALHYIMALAVLGIAYFHLSMIRSHIKINSKPVQKLVPILGVVLFLQIFYGNLTSGLKAGLVSSTFPLMNSQFLPPFGLSLNPLWTNLFENPMTVQWIHRWLGVLSLILIYYIGYKAITTDKNTKGPFIHLMGITTSQIILGILNIVLQVPISLAVIHQFIAALIVLGYLNIIFRSRPTTT